MSNTTEIKDLSDNINLLKQLAENDEYAQFNLANSYYNGEGTEKNLEKAVYWYQKAAENGNNNAMNSLARCYYNGEGTEKNLGRALHWCQKAAENGNKVAMNNLARC